MTEKYMGVRIRPCLRLAIYLRDGFKCVYCEKDLHGVSPETVTLDHLIPARMKHGHNKPTNLVTACRTCNSSRQDKPWKEFASEEAIKRITLQRHRGIKRRRKLAQQLIGDGLKSYHVTTIHYEVVDEREDEDSGGLHDGTSEVRSEVGEGDRRCGESAG